MEPLPFPRLNFSKVAAVSLAAFAVFAPTAAILLTAIDKPSWSDVGVVLASVAGGSLVIGFVPYLYERTAVALKRASNYDAAVEETTSVGIRLMRAAEYLRGLNADLAIQEIRDEGGTVHLILPYGTQAGLGNGATIEVVRQTGGEILGTVRVVHAREDWCSARPIDRRASKFWEGLEDRMASDFSPPAGVACRLFRITGSVVSDVLGLLEEENE